ncbi:protein DOWNSTREAM OF FLC-like [Aristolochia californica]|uniref:protein DOWNSTREAM OF FLC-like n=1 Tax=Aristolochia californica TaxID=171875 RepID=UPI0035D7296C
MAKQLIFIALCLLPALAAARSVRTVFTVQGRVYCDTCRAGFETPYTKYMPGAKVRVECKDRDTMKVLYTAEGITNKEGTYKILVANDHEDQICESVLVQSSQSECAAIEPGRERARVFLTNNNGIASPTRYANNLGFIKDAPIAGCAELLKQYQVYED